MEKSYVQIAIEDFSRRHPEVKLVKSMVSGRDINELESKLHIIIHIAKTLCSNCF